MLGRVMAAFDDATLGRFLTTRMASQGGSEYQVRSDKGACFWGVVSEEHGCRAVALPPAAFYGDFRPQSGGFGGASPSYSGRWYDALCARFGDERVNTAIRNRALTILARRERARAPIRESAVVVPDGSAGR